MSRVKLPKRGRLVIVKWDDSKTFDGWLNSGDAVSPAVNQTVGWLTATQRRHIVISSSAGDRDSSPWGQQTAIPRANLLDCRLLRIGKRP